jgi:hypothetical protein
VGEVVAGDWETRDAGAVGVEVGEIRGHGVPSNGTDCVQEVGLSATAGTFALGFDGAWTPQLDFDASASQVDDALNALPTIDGSCVVQGDTPYDVTFTDRLGRLSVPALETDVRFLDADGDPGTAVVTYVTPGVTATGRNLAPGTHYTDLTTAAEYVNTGSGTAPDWARTTPPADVAEAVADVSGVVPEGGAGSAAGGWSIAADRDEAIATVIELKTQFNALLASLRTAGIITP